MNTSGLLPKKLFSTFRGIKDENLEKDLQETFTKPIKIHTYTLGAKDKILSLLSEKPLTAKQLSREVYGNSKKAGAIASNIYRLRKEGYSIESSGKNGVFILHNNALQAYSPQEPAVSPIKTSLLHKVIGLNTEGWDEEITQDHADLAAAYVQGYITLEQARGALETTNTGVYTILLRSLRRGVLNNYLTIDHAQE